MLGMRELILPMEEIFWFLFSLWQCCYILFPFLLLSYPLPGSVSLFGLENLNGKSLSHHLFLSISKFGHLILLMMFSCMHRVFGINDRKMELRKIIWFKELIIWMFIFSLQCFQLLFGWVHPKWNLQFLIFIAFDICSSLSLVLGLQILF